MLQGLTKQPWPFGHATGTTKQPSTFNQTTFNLQPNNIQPWPIGHATRTTLFTEKIG
ncbi:MAG: hypothetical protein F6J90_21120 [Moorea sp. SIOASIH]|uniref:hypothetical protein n=1 Tax=Moorena sp. SIOASIH TaxID=2607817 RepID=UPI0013B7AE93|nr:hypothetical protein [Moorena sp. SIOASIH]NEO38695.1 hypothetical protein [Moorena sp. SIOASIH]